MTNMASAEESKISKESEKQADKFKNQSGQKSEKEREAKREKEADKTTGTDQTSGKEREKQPDQTPDAPDVNPEKNAARDTEKKTAKKDAPEMISFTREQVEKMEAAAKELDQAQKQIDTMKDQYLRLAAEYDNYRKRTAREKDALYQDAKADMIREFLAVYDNLERASKTEGDDDSPHKQGLIKIFNQSREILKKLNVKEIEALGQVFDPEKHNAVMHIEDEKLGENVISQVFQDGFMLGDKVIRHATVQVAN